MVGQKKLLDTIESSIQSKEFPKTTLLEGDFGCGKHTLARIISEKLEIPFLEITDMLSQELIEQITLQPVPHLYLIDGTKITVKEQNMILKFLEEPLENSVIVLITDSKSRFLPTVINRCISYTFESYSREELEEICPGTSESIFDYATTPGMIISLKSINLEDYVSFIEKIYSRIAFANFSNTFRIAEKINFSKEVDESKFDFNIFVYLMLKISLRLYKNSQISFQCFELTSDLYRNTKIANINKQQLFEHFIIYLKMLVDSEVNR